MNTKKNFSFGTFFVAVVFFILFGLFYSIKIILVTATTNGLIASWSFDEGSGVTTADGSGNGHNGTLNGSPAWTTGQINGSLDFIGTDGSVTVPSFAPPVSLTLEAWINPAANNIADGIILNKGNSEYDFRILGNGFLFGSAAGASLTDSSFNFYSNPGVWYHVAYTFDSVNKTQVLYRNGVQVATGANNGTLTSSGFGLSIGRHSQFDFGTFQGKIDEVKIFNRALSASEVLSDYQAVPVAPSGDVTPPVISGISSSAISQSGATIFWTTDENSNSQVDYGLTNAYGSLSGLNSSLAIAHSVNLSGLSASTLYHYRVKSRDASGNLAVSADQTLTTTAVVVADSAPTITSFTANPATITAGQSTTLSWIATGNPAPTFSINNNVGAINANQTSVSPSVTTTYTLTVTNGSGSVTAQTTVSISGSSNPIPPVSTDPVGPNATLATFIVPEKFGVSNPDQIIDFDYNGPYYSNMYMLDSSGNEIPFQKLSNGKIAVRINLPANTSKTFTLKSGKDSTATYTDQNSLSQSATYYEIVNGITGVRIPKGSGLSASQMNWAPIQGIKMKNGTWTPSGNVLTSMRGDGEETGALNAQSISTSIIENGPLETVIKVTYGYVLSSPIMYGSTVLVPAGPTYYTSTIKMEAGQPSILIEEDTNMAFNYKINMYGQVQPDQGQYAGHDVTDASLGYEYAIPGNKCTGANSGYFHECFRDFDYSTPITTSYYSSANSIAYTQAWNPWVVNTGWFWMLYNKAATSSAPLVGAFASFPSRTIGGQATGFSPYFLPNDGSGSRAAGLEFSTNRRSANNILSATSRYDWGIFVGTKGSDLPATSNVVPPINLQMNLRSGINLNKISRYQLTFNDPSGGYGRLFNDSSLIQNIITSLRAGGSTAKTYYDYLYNAEPTARPLIDLWSDPTGAKTHSAVLAANSLSTSILDAFINGMGTYDKDYAYWQGGLAMSNKLPFIDSILADSTLSAGDKTAIKADASLYSYLLYDDDSVPLDTFGGPNDNALNAGTANMPTQMAGYRAEYTLFMPQHPFLQPFVNFVTSSIDSQFQNQVSSLGASSCSPHYTGACSEPTIDAMLQAIMAGTNYFSTDVPRANRFGELLMQFSTPPEVRFKLSTGSIPRKMVEEGDGATEGTEMTGIVAQGFRAVNPTLAARLMGAWNAGGKVHSGFFTTTLSIINENAPAQDPQLSSDNFPGYMSVLRSDWNTRLENAFFLFNGDFLSATGHRHDDRGNIVLYALDAPLTLNWSSFYTPETWGGNMTSMVMPDTKFGGPGWNGDNQDVGTIASGWNSSTNDTFESFANSSMSNGKMVNQDGTNWERKLYSITTDPSLPIIMIKDNLSGGGSGKVMTLNLMATGPVSTPAGSIKPIIRQATLVDPATILPSVSQNIPLSVGVNQFKFSGQNWVQHPTDGIDWDLYTIGTEAQQAVIGNWGHVSIPNTEGVEYKDANGVNFAESQDILRVHGNNGFWTLILPYNKGTRPANLSVTQDPTTKDAVISYSGKTIHTNEHYYSYTDSLKTLLTSFDATAVSGNSMSISGGPMEISVAGTAATLTFSGSAGSRIFTMPLDVATANGVTKNGNNYMYTYNGGAPITVNFNGGVLVVPPVGDTTAPIISAVGSLAVTQVSATIGFTTDEAATTQVEYGLTGAYGQITTLDNTLIKNHSTTLSGLSAGSTYHYRLISKDVVGNTAITGDFTFTTLAPVIPDTIAPSAISNLSSSGLTQFSATLSFTAPGNDANIGTATSYDIRYSNANITAANFAQATQASGEPAPLISGTLQNYVLVGLVPNTTYFVAMKTIDNVNNVSNLSNVISFTTVAVPLTADITIPIVGITTPANNATVSGNTLNISATASDPVIATQINSGVVNVVFKVDGATVATDTTFPYSTIIDTTILSNGLHVITARATDVAGNLSLTATINITINNAVIVPPTPTLIVSLSATPSSGVSSLSGVALSATLSGTATGNSNYYFYCNRSDPATTTLIASDFKSLADPLVAKNTGSICAYTGPGTYTAKVIVERNAVVSESRTNITISAPVAVTPPSNNGGGNGSSTPAITGGVASPLDGQIVLTWIAPNDTTFIRTLIVRKQDSAPTSDSDGTRIYEGARQTFDDIGLTNGLKYYYALFPVLISGTASTPSVVLSAIPKVGVSQIDIPVTAQVNLTTTPTTTTTTIPGCNIGTTGFSITTGQSCVGNSSTTTPHGRVYNFGTTTLRNGSRGPAVMELQRFLNDVLNLGLVVDGKIGPKTIAVIKKWQSVNGLVADGLVGNKTKARMNGTAQ